MNIVPATREHIVALYDNAPVTVRAIAAVQDGRVFGIAGIYKDGLRDVAFVKITEELKNNRRAIIIGSKLFFKMFGHRNMLAIRDKCIDGADEFISHFGFKELQDGVYIWKA